MVHADFSTFDTTTITKKSAYEQVHVSLQALVDDQRNWVCNTANAASLLWHLFHSLPAPSNAVNWAGFYVIDPKKQGQLILGPFMGKVACQTIAIGKGVCGTVAARRQTAVVRDVHDFDGHIACDGDTKSEIVVPIVVGEEKRLVGVIDVDCKEVQGFDDEDRLGLE
ncbi:hypothetical protein DV737_g3274, partial [Chaetothyriales sp. CBS 132003]